ncbi:histidine kinase N-terminal 7TM domain-containing protein [Halorarum halobium]|uniref:histidine kinase N-terminal 7TM domain-containing protein n=1 Tax=Halorarum halobium TaxID=3075121 RepID=UPI0028B1390E|nr:histidine kinase N-terminal 7TM domain-containing protein [Halobaculum sp. XH14]
MLTGSVLVFFALVAAGTAVAVGSYTWRERAEPGAPSFVLLMVGVAVWSLSYAVALVTFDPLLREAMEVPLEVGKAIVAPAWLFFALGYTGRGEYVTRRVVVATCLVPAATLVLVATTGSHDLLWTNYRIAPTFGAATVLYDPEIWHYVHAAYGWAIIGAGLLLLLETVVSYGALYRDQGLALLAGAVVSFAAHVKSVFFLPPAPALDPTPLALALTGVAFAFALFRFELLGLVPATQALGRRAAIEDVGVGVVVVDADGRIIELNSAAAAVFGESAGTVVRDRLDDIAPDVDLDADGGQLLEFADADGYRTYEVTVSSIEDHHDRVVGNTVTFTDVTEREGRRQRLEVLNRVLRHNLRNGMTVVVGRAEMLEDRLEGPESDWASAVVERGRDLQELGEKARDVEDLVTSDGGERRERRDADLAALVRELAAALDDGTAVAVAVDAPESLVVTTRPAVVRAAMENLAENAVEHADRETTSITLTAEPEGDEVVLRVEDDGPGIPEAELEALSAGRETALSHGSGLGLWLVQWAARALGATLTFADREPRGTAVELRLPASNETVGTD